MKPVSKWLHRIGVPATCLFVAACGSSPQQEMAAAPSVVQEENYYIGKSDVYAHLESGSGGSWIFTKVTDSDVPPAKGYLVRLNDLAAAFDTRIAECTAQNYPTDHKCSPVHPFRSKDIGVIGKIISGGIAAGTGGKVTDVSGKYETSFDETTFNRAVDEALTNTGLDVGRRDLFAALENYDEVLMSSQSTLSALKTELDATYRDTANIQLDIQPDITGFTEYYSDDIDFRSLVELIPGTSTSIANLAIAKNELLPCNAPQCLQTVRGAIASLRADTENIETLLAKDISSRQNEYGIRCDQTTQAGYLFTLRCPAKVVREGTEPVQLPLSVHILARDFDSLYPRVDIVDENLSVAIAGDKVSFTNLTPNYLSVKAQTLYYNAQVHTISSEISVAPGATVTRPISEFASPAIDIESSFRQMTPGKAENTSFRFGFAANYRVAGETADTTLHELRSFNLACAIGDRVRPGSCAEAAVKDAKTKRIY